MVRQSLFYNQNIEGLYHTVNINASVRNAFSFDNYLVFIKIYERIKHRMQEHKIRLNLVKNKAISYMVTIGKLV